MKSWMPHAFSVVATVAAHAQKPFASVAVAGRPYRATTTWMPSACARGAERWTNGSSVIGGATEARTSELVLPVVAPATEAARSAQPRAKAAVNVFKVVPFFP